KRGASLPHPDGGLRRAAARIRSQALKTATTTSSLGEVSCPLAVAAALAAGRKGRAGLRAGLRQPMPAARLSDGGEFTRGWKKPAGGGGTSSAAVVGRGRLPFE